MGWTSSQDIESRIMLNSVDPIQPRAIQPVLRHRKGTGPSARSMSSSQSVRLPCTQLNRPARPSLLLRLDLESDPVADWA